MKTHTDSVNSDDSSLLPSDMGHAAGQAAHTPTPWHVEGRQILSRHKLGQLVVIANAEMAWSGEETEANAAFIVRACNSHAGLVEALRKIAGGHTTRGTLLPSAIARAALQSAKASP